MNDIRVDGVLCEKLRNVRTAKIRIQNLEIKNSLLPLSVFHLRNIGRDKLIPPVQLTKLQFYPPSLGVAISGTSPQLGATRNGAKRSGKCWQRKGEFITSPQLEGKNKSQKCECAKRTKVKWLGKVAKNGKNVFVPRWTWAWGRVTAEKKKGKRVNKHNAISGY